MALAQELKEEALTFASIEQQLRTINQAIGELTQKIGECKKTDFQVVLNKIDSARAGIEKALDSMIPQALTDSEQNIRQIETLLQAIMEKQEKNNNQLIQALKENTVFRAQVREGMQHDLNVLKEQQSGEQFNPLLKEIAFIYVEYQSLLEDEPLSPQYRKNLKDLFEQLEDILNDYDAEICRSEVGDVRQTRLCKIIEKIPTGNQEEHNTIAASRKPGVMRGKTVLSREYVDVYVYDSTLKNEVPEDPPKKDEIPEETESDFNEEKQGV